MIGLFMDFDLTSFLKISKKLIHSTSSLDLNISFSVSTHFHSLPKLLKHLEMYIEYATFQYDYDDEGQELVYFYKLIPG